METINCNLCGNNEYEVLERKGRYNLPVTNVVCRKCGLIFINPRMEQEEYRHFNLEDYRRVYKKPEEATEEFVSYQLYRGKVIFNFLSEHIRPNSRILDVSCTVGGVLGIFKQRLSCETYGTETAEKLAQYATDKFSVKVFNGFFENSTFPDNFFDLIIMSHVLEHLYSPVEALRLARRILKNDGKLYIEVPNIFKPHGRITSFFQIPHPYTFSPETATLLCEKAGLEIVKLDHVGNICILARASNSKENNVALSNDGHYLETIKALRDYKIKYLLYLRYLNFIREKFYWIKGKIGRLLKKHARFTENF